MSKKPIVKIITIPLIEQEVLFIYGVKDLKQLIKLAKKEGIPKVSIEHEFFDYDEIIQSINGTFQYSSFKGNAGMFSIIVVHIEDEIKELGVIVHEITHCVQKIKECFLTKKQEREFEAYITEYIFKQILFNIKKK